MKTKLTFYKSLLFSSVLLILGACATTQPVVTQLDSQMPKDGWREYSAGNAKIWLPKYFVGGDIQKELPSIIQTLEDMGPEYADIINMIKRNKNAFKFFAVAANQYGKPTPTNIVITEEKVPANIDLDLVARNAVKAMPNVKLMAKSKLYINGLEARKMFLRHDMQGLILYQESYLILANDSLWSISYTTLKDDYRRYESVFMNSIASFQVLGI